MKRPPEKPWQIYPLENVPKHSDGPRHLSWWGRKLRWAWCAVRGHPGAVVTGGGWGWDCPRCRVEGE